MILMDFDGTAGSSTFTLMIGGRDDFQGKMKLKECLQLNIKFPGKLVVLKVWLLGNHLSPQ